MARTTAVNFAGGLQFPMASAATDLFKKEDVQTLALAVDQHTHDGVGKGLNVVLNKSIDVADWFRSTGHTSAFASSGSGIEVYYDATNGGTLNSYNRTSNAWLPMYQAGSSFSFVIGGVAPALTIAADRSVAIPTTLTVTGAVTCNAALSVASNIACTGNLLMTATNNMQFPHGGTIFDKTDASGYVNISNLAVPGQLQVTGTGTFTGDMVAARVFIGADATRYILTNGALGLRYQTPAAGGGHDFVGSAGVHVTGPLAIDGAFSAAGALTASQVTVPNSLYSNGCVINNGTNNAGLYLYVNGPAGGSSGWNVIPSSIDYKTNVTPIANALDIVNDPALHGTHYTVSPDNLDPFETYGFIAEDWHLVAPETVSYLDGKPQGMDYGQVTAIVFEALKEHISQVDARLAALEAKAA